MNSPIPNYSTMAVNIYSHKPSPYSIHNRIQLPIVPPDLLKPEVGCDSFSNISLKEWWIHGLQKVEARTISYEKPTSLSCNTEIGSQNDFRSLQHWLKKEEVLQQERLLCNFQHLHLWHCECLVKLPQVLQSHNFLRGISIENCPSLVSLPEVDLPSQIRFVEIKNCNALESLPETWVHVNRTSLILRLFNIHCQRPTTSESEAFAGPVIRGCESLTSLFFETELPATLEHIELRECSNLVSLTSNGNLPKALKHLYISKCSKLEAVAERLHDESSLEIISIYLCGIRRSEIH
ncbi:hypothetical protein EZV62_015176 [Acer yangbiense]|uniref:Uncharacterized protein n=1 Tax=Acer yangbiense TaxID=1000413 RepID=A0A5C7HU11_9ROSI|nr:hypothetical protein EZV62_015176 [Acer yangbiense]